MDTDAGVYDRIDPYWIDFEMILVPHVRRRKWKMWAHYGVEFLPRSFDLLSFPPPRWDEEAVTRSDAIHFQ